jgi:antirestriction protein
VTDTALFRSGTMAKSAQASSNAARRVPRIYVASLSDYNAGRLHGAWLEATDIQQVRAGVGAMLKASPGGHAEGYAIHDFEGFSRYLPSESADLELVCAIGAAVVDHGTVFTPYLEHVGFPTDAGRVPALVAGFTESYRGAYESVEDWAEQYLEDTGLLQQMPESLRGYLDLESWADDAELNGDIFAVEFEGKLHVFSNR